MFDNIVIIEESQLHICETHLELSEDKMKDMKNIVLLIYFAIMIMNCIYYF